MRLRRLPRSFFFLLGIGGNGSKRNGGRTRRGAPTKTCGLVSPFFVSGVGRGSRGDVPRGEPLLAGLLCCRSCRESHAEAIVARDGDGMGGNQGSDLFLLLAFALLLVVVLLHCGGRLLPGLCAFEEWCVRTHFKVDVAEEHLAPPVVEGDPRAAQKRSVR